MTTTPLPGPIPSCGTPCSRAEVEQRIKEALCGAIPGLFQDNNFAFPESTLNYEWELFRHYEFAPLIEAPYPAKDPVIPLKYRQLIAIAIHAETKCKFCAPFHIALAKVYGATDEEIQEAVGYAKHSVGVSAYLNGLDFDLDAFLEEVKFLVSCLKRKIPQTKE